MAKPTSPRESTSIFALLLVAVLSAILVAGIYEIRSRLSRPTTRPPVSEQEQAAPNLPDDPLPTPSRETCSQLRQRYLTRCQDDLLVTPPAEASSTSPTTPSAEEGRVASELAAWLNPTQAELAEMARRCEVRLDVPAIGENQPPAVTDEQAASLSLSKDERALVEQTLKELHTGLGDFARRTATESGASPQALSALSLEEIITDLQSRPDHGYDLGRETLARERAGLIAPPQNDSEQSPGERLLRYWTGMGDRFEQRLAKALGPERARVLRASPQATWMNRYSQSGCPAGH